MLEITKSPKARLGYLNYGALVVADTKYSIETLRLKAAVDRFSLARHFSASAKSLNTTADYRSAISRAYYAMYHAFRAVVYVSFGGDDNQEHRDLPKHVPPDFPNRQIWENALKDARSRRNDADYDPYPKNAAKFAPVAATLIAQTEQLIPMVRLYLRRKGCKL